MWNLPRLDPYICNLMHHILYKFLENQQGNITLITCDKQLLALNIECKSCENQVIPKVM